MSLGKYLITIIKTVKCPNCKTRFNEAWRSKPRFYVKCSRCQTTFEFIPVLEQVIPLTIPKHQIDDGVRNEQRLDKKN